MGKRRRKMNNPKFKTKFLKARETYQRLRTAASNKMTEAAEVVEEIVVETLEKADDFLDKTQEKINALKFINEEEPTEVEKPKPKPKAPRKKASTTKAKPTTNTKKAAPTTRKRRTTKTKTTTQGK